MSATLMLGLLATMVATAFLSGIFGMAGGLILMGVLLAISAASGGHGAPRRDPDGLQRLARSALVAAHPLAGRR